MSVIVPYNFVPLNERVWFPKWATQLSHDIPFSDGVSGIIYYQVENKTPLFVGSMKQENKVLDFFSDADGKPMIPGSGIRGVIRNIHEILSFSKLVTDKERRLSIRDTYLREYKDVVDFSTIENRIRYGWLRKENGAYQICFVDARSVQNSREANVTTGGGPGTQPIQKYFSFDTPQGPWVEVSQKEMQRFEIAHKHVDGETFKNYQNTISDAKKGQPAPVFILQHNQKRYFGVCKYMRIPYNKSIGEKLTKDHLSENPDLTELIFGYTNDAGNLKSRVQFSSLKLEGEARYGDKVKTVLASPKPSYYPTYIEQDGHPQSTLRSYNTGQIRGFKRYPIHQTFHAGRAQHTIPDGGKAADNEDIRVKFRPLQKGHTFTGKIVFHNLKLVELGSLLSALTFHGQEECFHAIGMAKPLGYGKCNLVIDQKKSYFVWNNDGKRESINVPAFLDEFEGMVKEQLSEDSMKRRWSELFLMAKGHDFLPNDKTYMTIQEHRIAKKNREYLKRFSEIIN